MIAIDEIIRHIDNMTFDPSSIEGQNVDKDVLNTYRERFAIFVQDNCPEAILAYMKKAQRNPTINDITKMHILTAATKAMDGRDF